MDYNYVIWWKYFSDIYCNLEALQNVDKSYEISDGKSFANNFPPDACFHMSCLVPEAIKLSDNISNENRFPVVSKSLMEFIQKYNPTSVEMLPVTIYNHEGG